MGEIADMMLDGTMCQGCGVFLCDGEDGPGFPGWCSGCKPAGGRPKVRKNKFPKSTALIGEAIEGALLECFQPRPPARTKRPRTIPCPGCNRMFNTPDALDWHRKAKEH